MNAYLFTHENLRGHRFIFFLILISSKILDGNLMFRYILNNECNRTGRLDSVSSGGV